MNNNKFQVNEQFERFNGKHVIIGLRNKEEYEGTIITIDNFLNTVLKIEDGLKVIKGGKIVFISMKNK